MYMLKLLFQKLQSWLLGKQPTSWGTAKHYPLGTNWSHPDLCVPGRDRGPLPLGTANCPGRGCCSFFYLILPEFQSPRYTLFIPGYKKSALEREEKMVCYGMNPPSSRITGHLNKAPTKIWSLSLLIVFGSDRQPERWCLFRFHYRFMYIHLQRCRCARFCLLSLDLVYCFRFLIWVQKL